MEPEFADLIPLFVGEARGRLDRLAGLCPRVGAESHAATEARRELHTLKGAGRMLRLGAFAELCHAAEGVLQPLRPETPALLTRAVDGLAAMIDAVAGGKEPLVDAELMTTLGGSTAPSQASAGSAPPHPAAPAAPGPGSAEVRIDAGTVDRLAEQATRLRILARASGRTVGRLHELAGLAEAALREREPAQALPALAIALRQAEDEAAATQKRLQRRTEEQFEALLAIQLQPLQGMLLALARHARELGRSLGREIRVNLQGGETRLDRRITQQLEEALIHLVRNAIDHGIEPPEARLVAGKPAVGTITIEATTAGDRVRLAIADDGAGIDPQHVVEAAASAGLVEPGLAAALGRDEALGLVFLPGFSMRSEVTEISGRGIGLDAVAAAAARAGGTVSLASQPGHGTSVVVEVPIARRGEEVMLLRVGAVRLAIPSACIHRVDLLNAGEVVEREGRTLAKVHGRLVPFVALGAVLGETALPVQWLLQGSHAGHPLAAAADGIDGVEEVLVRPLGRALAGSPLLDGLALLPSGLPIAVLSPAALARGVGERAAARPQVRRLRVLLAEDSPVTLEIERRMLADAEFEVTTATDGAQAFELLAGGRFDCLVTDIEMPGLDGCELTRLVRTTPALTHLPVVVVSSHDRPEERMKGLEAGADAYLAKRGLDADELIGLVRRLGGA